MILEELWVPIEGYPDYMVSNYGGIYDEAEDVSVDTYEKSGVLTVRLEVDGDEVTFLVKRLVAEAFFQNYEHGLPVYHLNGDQTDCSVLNLTLGTEKVAVRG